MKNVGFKPLRKFRACSPMFEQSVQSTSLENDTSSQETVLENDTSSQETVLENDTSSQETV